MQNDEVMADRQCMDSAAEGDDDGVGVGIVVVGGVSRGGRTWAERTTGGRGSYMASFMSSCLTSSIPKH